MKNEEHMRGVVARLYVIWEWKPRLINDKNSG